MAHLHGRRCFNVHLPSGRSEFVSLPDSATLGDLKVAAQRAFAKGFLKLFTADGSFLDGNRKIEVHSFRVPITAPKSLRFGAKAFGPELRDVYATVIPAKLAATDNAFALCCAGDVVAWGDPDAGGNCLELQDSLKQIQEIKGTRSAFAALGDGLVVTWGEDYYGGDSEEVSDQLRDVRRLSATSGAFAALSGAGTVVTWGSAGLGFRQSQPFGWLLYLNEDLLAYCICVCQKTRGADRENHSIPCKPVEPLDWHHCSSSRKRQFRGGSGGSVSEVEDQLQGVTQIGASSSAFAAILADGHVVTWGSSREGGDSSAVQSQLINVEHVVGSQGAFAALRSDGSIVAWGNPHHGQHIPEELQDSLRDVQEISATDFAFAAICGKQRSVVTWGSPAYGGDSSEVQDQLREVREIASTKGAFAAILADGSVVTWGHKSHGGDSNEVRQQLQHVERIEGSEAAFCAIRADGSVVTWGRGYEVDTSLVQSQLKGVLDVCATRRAFAALTSEGRVITWGRRESGGDSHGVEERLRCL